MKLNKILLIISIVITSSVYADVNDDISKLLTVDKSKIFKVVDSKYLDRYKKVFLNYDGIIDIVYVDLSKNIIIKANIIEKKDDRYSMITRNESIKMTLSMEKELPKNLLKFSKLYDSEKNYSNVVAVMTRTCPHCAMFDKYLEANKIGIKKIYVNDEKLEDEILKAKINEAVSGIADLGIPLILKIKDNKIIDYVSGFNAKTIGAFIEN